MTERQSSDQQPVQSVAEPRRLKRGAPSEAEAAAWIAANTDAMESFNAYVEKHGLPLAKYRLF